MSDPRAEHLQRLLDAEVALAEAQAELGLVPASSVGPIRAAARAEQFDVGALHRDAARAGNLLLPLLAALTRRVADADPQAAGHVHWGVTSQDVIDTAEALRIRDVAPAILAALTRAGDGAAALARAHADTPMAGRTWLQQASPVSFGLKAAVWLDGLTAARARVVAAAARAQTVQCGGATGTLAALHPHGPAVAAAWAAQLGLAVAEVPWHTQRDRMADLACALGLACGVLGKIAGDVALLSQTEVGEVREPAAPGRGGSSSMPHKRNPVASAVALAAAVRAPGLVASMLTAMGQEHERALGGWQAEWDTLPALLDLTRGAAEAMGDALGGLEVDVARMRANLNLEGGIARAEGLAAALAPALGRTEAQAAVAALCDEARRTGRALDVVARASARVTDALTPEAVGRALDPAESLGASRPMIAAALARWQAQEQ